LRFAEDVRKWAKGTSGEEGVVKWANSGGGVRGAVDGSVVKFEKTGGDTSCVSWAYGPVAYIVFEGPPGEFADNDKKQLGDCAVEGRAECVKDAGEDGGAKREGAMPVAWLVNPATWGPFGWLADPLLSGIRDAGTMRFPPFCELKQENAPKQPPHLFLCQCKSRKGINNM